MLSLWKEKGEREAVPFLSLDDKVIVAETKYNAKGQVEKTSFPYFENLETPRWTFFEYDGLNRLTKATNPDNTYSVKQYSPSGTDIGTVVITDANGHRKDEIRDIYGRLKTVKEYTGTNPAVTLYATTTYAYDVLNNLTRVTDQKGNQTNIAYDSLSRKVSMTDPDMGSWTYQYDANGNLWKQTDARNYTITFTYDPLNRVTLKDYPAYPITWTDINYYYDEGSAGYYNIGKLTRVTDISGTEKLYYDELGRVEKTEKTVYSTVYTTETTRDELGRTDTIRYPDNTLLQYLYDNGGNISQAVGYATFSGYNALGQPGTVTYGNGVTTTYTYDTTDRKNNRLKTIQTGSYQNLVYTYDNAGNITNITDNLNTARTQTFIYDDLNRLKQAISGTSAYGTIDYSYNEIGNMTYNSKVGSYTYGTKPHAATKAGSYSYSYDSNGNMTSKAGTTITYNYDNMPVTVGSVTFVYDYSGQRVKKNSTVYIGKLYECTSGSCTKYYFAGSNRIAQQTGSTVYYYHTDHLGSSSVITRQDGTKYGEFYYHPYGKRWYTSGGSGVRHKFTGQEEDAEIGLYNYGARLYEPNIGRFISADSIVPDFSNPQALNRYSYCGNNPIIYTDPSGHFFVELLIGAVIGAFIGGTTSAIMGGDVLQGMMIGAVSGAVFAGVGGTVSDAIVGASVPGGIGPPTAGWAAAAQIGGGMAGGASAGATTSAMTGGNIGKGALIGGVIGGVMGGINAVINGAANQSTSAGYKQYADAYTTDAGTLTSQDEIIELTRLTYAESAREYNITNAMEGVAWTVRNRVDTAGWPDTYYGVIHQPRQFSSIGTPLWKAASNPQTFSGSSLAAYSRAFTVSAGVYNGTIADPTGGALFFHSGAMTSLPAKSATFFGTLSLTVDIKPFHFYK